jgi:hypothetical protein
LWPQLCSRDSANLRNAPEMAKDQIFKLRLEEEDRKRLDSLAEQWGVTAANAVRQLIKEASERAAETQYRVSAWDGMKTTCLFWFGPDEDMAIARANELARAHAGDRWTVFRVFRGGEREPFHRASVAEAKRRKPAK